MTSNQTQNQTQMPRKYGRTLLFKPVNGVQLSDKYLSELKGVVSSVQTKTTGSHFVLFDTQDSASVAHAHATANFKDVLVKYSYYRVFFTMSGLTDDCDYNKVKESFVNYLETTTESNILFFKLYRKNNQYIGCGDFTLDTLDGMNVLLDKETGLKSFTLGNYTGKFFRYNASKSKPVNASM
jgi:hypothetical protein